MAAISRENLAKEPAEDASHGSSAGQKQVEGPSVTTSKRGLAPL